MLGGVVQDVGGWSRAGRHRSCRFLLEENSEDSSHESHTPNHAPFADIVSNAVTGVS